jgi:hypothetical protein
MHRMLTAASFWISPMQPTCTPNILSLPATLFLQTTLAATTETGACQLGANVCGAAPGAPLSCLLQQATGGSHASIDGRNLANAAISTGTQQDLLFVLVQEAVISSSLA